ncbi:unnamed protein product [Vitrella brassicaformis CCMP3155]|uniref:GST N-terminal domain-containing protein n=3 Tax=Vitrella brassicaformis TaxID=1169539 RepID=A0A0G4EJE6_VITBC|nr:unnamed protein product [Vitrella brassicaformis CCMP3155]|eukprot:CEL96586.1 unnamed protein product [Vitrella brassicaformis CCMP3155]
MVALLLFAGGLCALLWSWPNGGLHDLSTSPSSIVTRESPAAAVQSACGPPYLHMHTAECRQDTTAAIATKSRRLQQNTTTVPTLTIKNTSFEQLPPPEFMPRYGLSALSASRAVVVMGGSLIYHDTSLDDVWITTDGVGPRRWKLAPQKNETKLTRRSFFGAAVHPSADAPFRFLVTGGLDISGIEGDPPSRYLNDVLVSRDGTTWRTLVDEAPWKPREGHQLVVIPGPENSTNATFLLLGGQTAKGIQHDVWRSTNGIDWELLSRRAPWRGRRLFQTAVTGWPGGSEGKNMSVYVMGGEGLSEGHLSDLYNDVWRSDDLGVTWSEVTKSASWPPRYGFGGLGFFHGGLLVIGGATISDAGMDEYLNDIWYSPDGGKTWKELLAKETKPFSPCAFFGLTIRINELWLIGGMHLAQLGQGRVTIPTNEVYKATLKARETYHDVTDCEQSAWSEWSQCDGQRTRNRTTITEARNGGEPCGDSVETENCTVQRVETCEGDECAARTVLFSLRGCPCIERSCQKEGLNIPGLERFCIVREEDCGKGPCTCEGPILGQFYDACVEGGIEQVFTNGGCRCIKECRRRSNDDKPTCPIHPREECADQSATGSYTLPECDSPKWEYQLRPPTFCAGVEERLSSRRKAHWTHLVYMNADNNLESYAMSDLKEMLQIPKSDFNLLVLVDRADPEVEDSSHRAIHDMVICPNATSDVNARVARQQFSGAYELLMIGDPYENQNSTSRRRWLLKRDLEESNMDDGQVLREFIAGALKEFPAEHYALTLWDHGVGRKGFGGDSSHGNWDSLMNLWALETNIRNGAKDAGMPDDFRFDLLSFDACLMASYEVTTALASQGHFFLGSETLISGTGWDWKSLRPTQPNGTATPPLEYARKIALATMDLYVRKERLMTLAIVDLYKILEFRKAFAQRQRTLTKRLHDCVDTKEVDRIRTAYQRADDSLRGRQASLFSGEIVNPVDMGMLLQFLEAEVERVMPADELDSFSFKDAIKKYNESIVYFNGSDNFGNIPLTGLHADLTLEEPVTSRLLEADEHSTSEAPASDARQLQDDAAKWGAGISDDPNWQSTGTPNDLRVFLEPIYDTKRTVCRARKGPPELQPKFVMLNCTLYLMSSAGQEADSTAAAPRYRVEVFRNTSSGAAAYTALKTIMTKPKPENDGKFQQAFVVTAEQSPDKDELADYVIDHVTAEWEGEGWILHQSLWTEMEKFTKRGDCKAPSWIRQCPAGFGDAVPARPATNEGSDRTFERQCVWLSALASKQSNEQSNGATRRTLQIPARLYRSFTDFTRQVKDARRARLVIDYNAKSPDESRLSLFAANRFGVEAEVSSQDWGLIEPLHTYVNLTAVDGSGRYDMAPDDAESIQSDVPSCFAFMWGSDPEAPEREADKIEVLQWPPAGSGTPGQAEEAEDGDSRRALQDTDDDKRERVLGIKAKETIGATPKVIGSFVVLSEANSQQRHTNTGCSEYEKDPTAYCKTCDALALLGEADCAREEDTLGCSDICARFCEGNPCARRLAGVGGSVLPEVVPSLSRLLQRPSTMSIDLYSIGTPNGQKITVALEEMGIPYKEHLVHIGKNDQFKPVPRISPNNKIPAIVDNGAPGGPLSLFESGAILLYLAEKSGKFMPSDLHKKYEVTQWLMWQMGGLGPMLGQMGHFWKHAAKNQPEEKLAYGQERYFTEGQRLWKVLDTQLEGKEYVCGDISIADFAIFPWLICVDKFYGMADKFLEYKNVQAYIERMWSRPAVKKGMAAMPFPH